MESSIALVLSHPVKISSRLIPGVQLMKGWIAVELTRLETTGRAHWRFYIDTPDGGYASDESGVTVMPLAGETPGDLARKALAVICQELGSEDGELAFAGMSEVERRMALASPGRCMPQGDPRRWLPRILWGWLGESRHELIDLGELLNE